MFVMDMTTNDLAKFIRAEVTKMLAEEATQEQLALALTSHIKQHVHLALQQVKDKPPAAQVRRIETKVGGKVEEG